jgi:hypothetical protein
MTPLPTAKESGEGLESHCGHFGERSLPTKEIQTHLAGSPCRGLVRALNEFLMYTEITSDCDGLNTEFEIGGLEYELSGQLWNFYK